MPFRITLARCRGLLLVFTLLMGSSAVVAHAQGTPAPSATDVSAPECDMNEPVCQGDQILVEFLAHGRSADTSRAWVMARITLEPGAMTTPGVINAATHYTVYVEQGTVGLTASIPVTCVGECRIEAPETVGTTTSESGSLGGVLVPAGTEVILSPGDMAVFESTEDSTHVYRNAGETDAEVVSNLSGPALLENGRCRGRCLEGF